MLDVSTQGRIGILSINRPQRRNAMDRDLVAALVQAFRTFRCGSGYRRHRPDRRGAGLLRRKRPEIHRPPVARGDVPVRSRDRRHGPAVGFVRKPVVAAVEGFALGGGFILAVSCDLVVSSDSARWHLPEVPIGWLTPWGLGALVSRVGAVAARKLCFASEAFDGREASASASSIISPRRASARETALALAQRLAGLPAASVIRHQAFLRARHIRPFRSAGCRGERGLCRQLPSSGRARDARAVRQPMINTKRKVDPC